MRVTLLGFGIELAKGVSIGEFYQQVERIEGEEIKLSSRKSVLYTDVIDGLICGLVLSYKSNKKSLITARDRNGDLVVTKNILKNNEHGTEVSLFVINPDSLKGIFYSYSGSVSPTGFYSLLKKRHDEVLKYKRKSYREELTNFGQQKVYNLQKKIMNRYSGAFSLKLLATPSDLNKLLPRYKEINQVVLRATNALSEGGRYTPLEDLSKKTSIIVDFEQGGIMKEIRKTISQVFSPFAKQKEGTALRIIGSGYSGEELSLIVGENNDNFGNIEYDDYVELLPTKKWKDYVECEALKRLINKVKATDVVFGSIPPGKSWKIEGAKDVQYSTVRDLEMEI